jgi:hypothetical protein
MNSILESGKRREDDNGIADGGLEDVRLLMSRLDEAEI